MSIDVFSVKPLENNDTLMEFVTRRKIRVPKVSLRVFDKLKNEFFVYILFLPQYEKRNLND